MGIEYFLFALMLFGMVLIVFFLFFYGKGRRRRAEEEEWAKRKEKLMLLYFEVQDLIDSFKSDVNAAREWGEAQLGRMEAESESIRMNTQKSQKNESSRKTEMFSHVKKAEQKTNEIEEMYQSGIPEEEIAEKLRISRNELKFILKMNAGRKQQKHY